MTPYWSCVLAGAVGGVVSAVCMFVLALVIIQTIRNERDE